MTEVQVGTTTLPILITPRIAGVPVTQTQIKNDFSNVFVDDNTTPLTFGLEYRQRGEPATTQAWSETDSTDEIIFFPMPDSFYAETVEWTLLPFWEIVGVSKTEKIYADEAIQLSIKNLHLGV